MLAINHAPRNMPRNTTRHPLLYGDTRYFDGRFGRILGLGIEQTLWRVVENLNPTDTG